MMQSWNLEAGNLESGSRLEAGKKNIGVRTARRFKLKINKEIKPETLISQSVKVKRRRQGESDLDRLSNAEPQTASLSHLDKLSRLLPLLFLIENEAALCLRRRAGTQNS